jgi:uncharacterized protein
MRLTESQIEIITTLVRKYFSDNAIVFLFGSRTDDRKKGGDIDLFISTPDETLMDLTHRIAFLVELKRRIGDRKIDLVFDNSVTRSKKNFYHSIVNNYIRLTP